MNEARRNAVRIISNVLEALIKEVNTIADEEKKAFENRPAGSQYSPSGEESEDAQTMLEEAILKISDGADALWELAQAPS
jgi:hypothetical protein